jgi:polyferredoxin
VNLREDIQQLKTGRRDLRKFGLTVGAVFVGLGLLFLFRHKARTPYFVGAGLGLMFFGAVLPRALKWIYLAWMSIALALGFVVAHVILTVFFFLVVTPIGLLARATGKDFLSLKLNRSAPTYWIRRQPKPRTAADYERQF